MDRMLYLAMTGAKHTLLAQQGNSHNLANANTPGFKADLDVFQDLPVYGPGQDSRVYAVRSNTGHDLNSGTLMQTGRNLDVAILGEGWITVQTETGDQAYSRRGDLRIGTDGLLSDGAGNLVLGNGGPVTIPPYETLLIGKDGNISIRPLGQAAGALASVDRLRLVNPDATQIYKGEDGLFRSLDNIPAPPDAAVQLTSGALESANVNVVEVMVNMIEFSRSFEAQIKLMKAAEANDETSARLLRSS